MTDIISKAAEVAGISIEQALDYERAFCNLAVESTFTRQSGKPKERKPDQRLVEMLDRQRASIDRMWVPVNSILGMVRDNEVPIQFGAAASFGCFVLLIIVLVVQGFMLLHSGGGCAR
jgi:hypothetical protein